MYGDEKKKPYKKIIALIFILGFSFLVNTGKIELKFAKNIYKHSIVRSQNLFFNIKNGIDEKFKYLGDLKEEKNKNIELTKKIEKLENEKSILTQYKLENLRLKKLLNFEIDNKTYEKKLAYIIGKDHTNWNSIFVINKGEKHGISKNDVVLNNKGLVGRIYELNSESSKVLPIIDSRSSISVIIDRISETGILKGALDYSKTGYITMKSIDYDADISINDKVYTSMYGVNYDSRLYIGKIKKFESDISGLSKIAYIEPAVDFKHIREVVILTNTNSERED